MSQHPTSYLLPSEAPSTERPDGTRPRALEVPRVRAFRQSIQSPYATTSARCSLGLLKVLP